MTPQQYSLLAELVAANAGEAVFRPSSADRLMLCPGSIVMSARIPKIKTKSTPAQAEGTAAHRVAEDALKGIRQPDEYSDRMIRFDEYSDRMIRFDDKGMEGHFVDEEMVNGVEMYLAEVYDRERPGTERFVERRLSLSPLDPSDPLLAENRGTGDCVVLDRERRRLTVLELKYGKGVMVPGGSPQLKDYALMTMVSVSPPKGGWAEIETVVVQPRAFSDREQVKAVLFTPIELFDFAGHLVGAMESALDVNAPLNPGEKQCMWCPAKGICPAHTDRATNIARDAFARMPIVTASAPVAKLPDIVIGTSEQPKPVVPAGTVMLPHVLSLDPADIATLLDRFDIYDQFKQAVQQRAAQLIQAGVSVPNWVVEPRTGNRRWIDPKSAELVIRQNGGLSVGAIYTEPKLKSPAQIEKMLPKDKRDIIETLIERPLGSSALIRANSSKGNLTATETRAIMGPIG